MTRHVPVLLSAAAMAILVALTLRFAQSSDVGSADRAKPVAGVASAPVLQPAPSESCVLTTAGGGAADAALTVTGACSGAVIGPFSCAEGDDALDGSVRSVIDVGRSFFLTLIVPAFNGAGHYDDAMLFAQVVGTRGVSRWTNRAAPVAVDDGGAIHLEAVDLDAEPGTSTAGSLTLSGSIRCG